MIPLIVLTIIGAVLRFTNLNWDMGAMLHPDEAFIVNGALTIRFFSHLFPGFHDYNGFSMYLLRCAAAIVAWGSHNSAWITAPESLTLVGRFLSAALATVSIPLVYAIGISIAGIPTGLIAALLFAFAPLSIQLSHFYTTDTLLVFLLLSLLYAVLLYWRKPTLRGVIAMAIAAGVALATKNTAYLFLPLPVAVIALSKTRRVPLYLAALTGLVVIIFFIASPYSFLDFSTYISHSKWIANVVNGTFIYGWSAQFKHTTPLFWFENLIVGLGASALLGPVGILAILIQKKLWRRSNRNFPLILFSFWTIGFGVFLATTYLKFIRYDAPLIPVFTLFAALVLASVIRSRFGKIILAVVLSVHILWGIMVFHIYRIPHTSITAANWIAGHIPKHATIMIEDWNYGIINFESPRMAMFGYTIRRIDFYAAESSDKQKTIADALEKSDYFISESPKIKNTIHRVRAEFSDTEAYYQKLTSGTLGFIRVATFASYPQLGPLVVNDENTEETWTVFDHPTITIYQKIPR